MEYFNIVSGGCSIASFIISLIALGYVYKINFKIKKITLKESFNSYEQDIKGNANIQNIR